MIKSFTEYEKYKADYNWLSTIVNNNVCNEKLAMSIRNMINNFFRLYVNKWEHTTYEEYAWQDYNKLLNTIYDEERTDC